jgi:hypothetical protein
MHLILFREFESVYFDTETGTMSQSSNSELLRYLKGLYKNKERFLSRFLDEKLQNLEGLKSIDEVAYTKCKDFFQFLIDFFDDAIEFTIKEAFELPNREFQALVFSSINISEMISDLGAVRYKTDGIEVKRRVYDNDGKHVDDITKHNVYEVWEVDGQKLGLEEKLYVLKVWCDSTNKEHWLWFNPEFKDDPLSAIASTFMIHENLIPHISCLKRQGDIMLVELKENVEPSGEVVSLTKEQYFNLLVAES